MKDMPRAINFHHSWENYQSINCIRNFWKKFSILNCIGYADNSWQEVAELTLNRSWSKLLLEFVTDSCKPADDLTTHKNIVQGGKRDQWGRIPRCHRFWNFWIDFVGNRNSNHPRAGIAGTQSDCKKEENQLDTEFRSQSLVKIKNGIQSRIRTWVVICASSSIVMVLWLCMKNCL